MSAPATIPSSSSPAGDDRRASHESDATLGAQMSSIMELTKPRITKLVVITSGVGFALAALGRTWDGGWTEVLVACAGCLVGTALSSAGASALNMWWERKRDARMPRTAKRPLPQGKLSAETALTAGLMLSLLGVLLLSIACGPAPALISLITIVLYVLVYTPLKTLTTLNTIVGAVPGALPPMIGWTAGAAPAAALWTTASGGLSATERLNASLQSLSDPAGWSLVVLMTVWQIPHFLALAWMYRDDYARGGYRMLPIDDPDGKATMTTALIWAIALVPSTLAPAIFMRDRLGPFYVAVATVLGLGFVYLCWKLMRDRSRANAKRVFLASIIHLPVMLMMLVVDALLHTWERLL